MTVGTLQQLPVPPMVAGKFRRSPSRGSPLVVRGGEQGTIDIDTSKPAGPYMKGAYSGKIGCQFKLPAPNRQTGILEHHIVTLQVLKAQAEVLLPGQNQTAKLGMPKEDLDFVRRSPCTAGT